MSTEKRLLLFLAISFGFLFLYSSVFAPKPAPTPKAPAEAPATGTAAEAPAAGTGGAAPVAPPGPGVSAPPADPSPAALTAVAPGKGEETVVDGGRVRWRLDSFGGSLRGAALKEFAQEAGQDLARPEHWYRVLSEYSSDGVSLAPEARRSLALRVLREDGSPETRLPLDRVLWTRTESTADRVTYALPVPEAGVELTKTFLFPAREEGLAGAPYHLRLTLGLTVTDPARAASFGTKGWRLRLSGPAGLPVEAFTAGITVVGAALTTDTVSVEEISPPGKADAAAEVYPEPEKQSDKRLLEWVGLHTRFFTAMLRPADPAQVAARQAVFLPFKDLSHEGDPVVNLEPALDFTLPLPPLGGTATREFLFYAGPMDPKVFEEGPYRTFDPILDYGLFGFIAKALVFLLRIIRSVVGNWGIAIIILTILVRLALFPLSRKSQFSMQKQQRQMARLKPKVDALKERHGKNRKKLNEEMMKLYREEGVRVFPAGCLIILLQLPVFIGLFQALRYSIGLRHSQFLWAVDLTTPDQLLGPVATKGIPLIPDPFYLNVFPIVMAVTWFLSSALAPKPADPQQAQSMKIMRWMTIVFSLMLYNYPAGLALYMVVSSTWGIFETKVVKKMLAAHEPAVAPVSPTFRKGR